MNAQSTNQTREILPDLESANSAESTHEPTPVISVDRSLAHVLDDIDINLENLREFYDALPYNNKCSLDRLRIHFSAARPVNKRKNVVSYGAFMPNGTRGAKRSVVKASPELEETTQPTIVIYVGSVIIGQRDGSSYVLTPQEGLGDYINGSISETLKHELIHFAQWDGVEITPSRIKDRRDTLASLGAFSVISLLRNKDDIFVGGIAMGAAELATSGGKGAIVAGIGAAAASNIVNRRRRLTEQDSSEFKRYLGREKEREARGHERIVGKPLKVDLGSISVAHEIILPKDFGVDIFTKAEGRRLAGLFANTVHKELSLTPRGLNPAELRGQEFRQQMASIRRRRR